MTGPFRQSPGNDRSYFFAAASTLCAAGALLVLSAEQAASASEPVSDFAQAFTKFELTEHAMEPAPATVAAATQRYENAPTEEEAAPEDRPLGSGSASYYGARFAGRRTASGEAFDPSELTAAHRTLPFGSRVKVTNRRNGRSVIVRINDRGPFHGRRVIDLSREAAKRIDLLKRGHGIVELALVTS